ncbi:unnamed protein product [Trifolium pratense]|uniref:Uncharacterized protein n=1 Tax=Trifolium pratense TaxID=57577 RepID=A0ACB0LUG5_TRIPR|nr:unnamed protein product [Trifolium pratense]
MQMVWYQLWVVGVYQYCPTLMLQKQWLRKSLAFARDLLFLSLQAGSDNSNMIAALTNKQQVSAYWDTIVEDCIKLTFSLNSFSFTNVRRVANQTIHYLAKLALSSTLGFIWIEETTSCIFEVVAFDLPPESVQ